MAPTNVIVSNLAAYSPAETIELVSRAGVKKGNMRLDKIFLSAVSAGCLLAFACAATLSTNTAPWMQTNAPGLIRTIAALIFPFGLCLIVMTGADLFTGSHMIFLRGIGCNWLVCLACFLGTQAKDLGSKLAGVWWPTFAFVALGLDHVVANMFFIPIGIHLGTPGLSVGLYIWKGIIPVGLGNIVGGALFVGTFYWYMYLLGEPEVVVDGDVYHPNGSGSVLYGLREKQLDLEAGGKNAATKEGEKDAGCVEGSVLGG
ncbi:912f7f37-a0f1-40c2-a840-dbb91869aa8b [Thermothielavioides terrestris]|uniref:912f7f37-a0f1-40c2-a840-dbb91869aa8b n=1 Tax=Thermothielavioides terrestris TaxID=2587410 RepID=A0A446BS94_9PEZI|nr:912f7f37-a0f1-40c2-a840-dbb91869aa8b [Thermothielavioides terrestris]